MEHPITSPVHQPGLHQPLHKEVVEEGGTGRATAMLIAGSDAHIGM